MKYEKLDSKTKKMIDKYLGKAEVPELKTIGNYEDLFVAMVDGFLNYQLSLDDFAVLCGEVSLMLEAEKVASSEKLNDYLLMADDLTWYIRSAPNKAAEIILATIDLAESLKKRGEEEPKKDG